MSYDPSIQCPNCNAEWPTFDKSNRPDDEGNCSVPNGGCGWPDKAQMEMARRIHEAYKQPERVDGVI